MKEEGAIKKSDEPPQLSKHLKQGEIQNLREMQGQNAWFRLVVDKKWKWNMERRKMSSGRKKNLAS